MKRLVKHAGVAVIALLMGSRAGALAACGEDWQAVAASPVSAGRPPALLRAIADAGWRIDAARRALPPVQLVHDEALEIQDFIQRAYDGGALRLIVRPGPHGEIIALLADTSSPPYRDFARLGSTRSYVAYHHAPYVVVVPVRPVSQALFDKLKARRWTKRELGLRLGAPSFDWHVHGVGYFGVTYVPQGLSFIGDDGTYQLFGPDFEMGNGELPPIESFSRVKYATLQRSIRDEFANDLLYERDAIDRALANGKRSPDGRFVVGHVNLGGGFNSEEVVFGEQGKPERRYRAPHFTYDKDYRWLDAQTVLVEVYVTEQEFHTVDALTGSMKLVASVPDEPPTSTNPLAVIDFGVSDPHTFWYKTADGVVHDVAVQAAAAPGR